MRAVLITLFVFWCFQLVDCQLEGGELCLPCLEYSAEFFGIFENSTDISIVTKYIDEVCDLLPRRLEKHFCKELGEDILERLEDDADSFFQDFTAYTWCTVAAMCPCPCCIGNGPEQVHLSVTGSPYEMVITWIQAQNVTDSFVKFHLLNDSSSVSQWNDIQITTYWQGGWVGFIYQAVITGLQPDTKYNYTVGSDSFGTTSPGYFFTTPPLTDTSSDTTFAIYGDMGDSPSADQVMFVLREATDYYNIDLILHAGDIAYTNGYQKVWDDWMRKMTPIFSSTPYMAVEGNHESKHLFAPYKHRFRNPYQESGSPSPKYFSFDYGNIHFIAFTFEDLFDLDNNPDFGIQHNWIEQDLQKVNRTATPWIVAYAHRPLYCSDDDANRCIDESSRYRHQLEGLFDQFSVDMVISGHNHNFERTYPVYQEQPTQFDYNNPSSPVYAVVGSAGRGLHYGWQDPAPTWSVESSRISEWGFAVISTVSNQKFQFQWIEAYTSTIMDSFTIVRTE